MWRQVVATLQGNEPSSGKWRQLVAKFDEGVVTAIRALVLEAPWGPNLVILNKVQGTRSTTLLIVGTSGPIP